MKAKSPITLMAEAIHGWDPSLTREQAGEVAASIGDRPIRVGDEVLGFIGVQEYYVPWRVLYAEEERDEES